MDIYFVQHGKALDPSIDPEKGLSKDGIFQTAYIAKLLAKLADVELIIVSDKRRSKQSGEIFQKAFENNPLLIETKAFSPDSDYEKMVAFLLDYQDIETLLIIGHLPSMLSFINHLLGPIAIGMENSSILCVETNRLTPSSGVLKCFIPYSLAGELS